MLQGVRNRAVRGSRSWECEDPDHMVGVSRRGFPVWRLWQESNLRIWLRRPALYPLSYRDLSAFSVSRAHVHGRVFAVAACTVRAA